MAVSGQGALRCRVAGTKELSHCHLSVSEGVSGQGSATGCEGLVVGGRARGRAGGRMGEHTYAPCRDRATGLLMRLVCVCVCVCVCGG